METLSYCQLMQRCGELEAQVKQLAAENAALKGFAWAEAVAADEEKEDRYMMECTGARNRFLEVKTPSTDDYAASLRAEGVEMVLELIAHTKDMLYADSVKATLIDFAAQLRSKSEVQS